MTSLKGRSLELIGMRDEGEGEQEGGMAQGRHGGEMWREGHGEVCMIPPLSGRLGKSCQLDDFLPKSLELTGIFRSTCSSTCRRMTQVSHLGHSRLDLLVDLSKVPP
jgi:hypothetical protein